MLQHNDSGAIPTPTFTKHGHRYKVNGEYVPSVTTILKEGFPAPALVSWAARTTAGYAVDRWDELGELPVSQRLRELERAAWAQRDAAALRGTDIHAYGEQLVRGEEVSIPDEYVGPAEAYARFLDAWKVTAVLTETPVCHPAHGWAGTLDLVAMLGDDDRSWLLDLKTGKGIYESHVLQQAAYAHAAFYLSPAGTVEPWRRPHAVGVVHIGVDGCELIPVDAGDRAYAIFGHAAHVAKYARDVRAAFKDRQPWPVGRPLDPTAAVTPAVTA